MDAHNGAANPVRFKKILTIPYLNDGHFHFSKNQSLTLKIGPNEWGKIKFSALWAVFRYTHFHFFEKNQSVTPGLKLWYGHGVNLAFTQIKGMEVCKWVGKGNLITFTTKLANVM